MTEERFIGGWTRASLAARTPAERYAIWKRARMLRTADGMWQDPAWHEIILEEPEVWGVQELSSEAVLMRVTARTVPLRQWEVQRELTARLKLALDSAGAINGASTGTEPDGALGPLNGFEAGGSAAAVAEDFPAVG